MSIRLPPINGLIAFEAVARLGSFSKAAQELSVTQSAISHRIGQLESMLGANVLLRLGHLVGLTAQGEELLPHVRMGLECFRTGVGKAAGHGKTTVRLSLAPAIASNWLIQRLSSFHRHHPDINLDIVTTSRYQDIRNGEADVAIRFGNGAWEGLDAVQLIPDRIFPVCSPNFRQTHHWLKSPHDLSRATLLRHALIPWRPWFDKAGVDAGEPRDGLSFSEVSMLIDAAEHSQGVALVPGALVENQLKEGKLVRLFDIELESGRAYYLVTAAGKARRPEVQALTHWLQASAADVVGHRQAS